jgi:hypothetical protein
MNLHDTDLCFCGEPLEYPGADFCVQCSHENTIMCESCGMPESGNEYVERHGQILCSACGSGE